MTTSLDPDNLDPPRGGLVPAWLEIGPSETLGAMADKVMRPAWGNVVRSESIRKECTLTHAGTAKHEGPAAEGLSGQEEFIKLREHVLTTEEVPMRLSFALDVTDHPHWASDRQDHWARGDDLEIVRACTNGSDRREAAEAP